nr:FAD-dependent oxidoreductase [Clostridia bacterium]
MIKTVVHETELCVVGGGLAGMCAAIAAAREGQKVVLMHERPMLGGNASSEIRMWISGAYGENNRETGILEEIELENFHLNPYKLYPVWDALLYEKVKFEPNITLLLNCSCCDAEMDGNKIVSVKGWQLTTQQWHVVKAKYFSDCSGDSILAPLTGADFRIGRESKTEFGENVSTEVPDKMTMGMSCLIQARKMDHKVKFVAPEWATKITDDIALRRNPGHAERQNYWWLELGGDRDSIGETEEIRDDLVALAYGVWDYYKNSGKYVDEGSDYWQIDFLGFLPGKRESRRMMGPYIMTSVDIMEGGKFEDTIAFGGWPLDDHEPRGFWFPGHPNTNGRTPSPYGIPYRVLYSRNIENLFFAGRNVSLTHMAMSSTRVMATCGLLGQAVGTASAIAGKYNTTPNGVYTDHLEELKQTLMYNDSFLPHNKRTVSDICLDAELSGDGNGDINNLRNGIDRNNHTYGDTEQGYDCPYGGTIEYKLAAPTLVNEARIIFDSDLCRRTIPGKGTEQTRSMRANIPDTALEMKMPTTLVKEFKVEAVLEDGSCVELMNETKNLRRLVKIPVGQKITSLKLTPVTGWGSLYAHIFSFDFN